MIGSDILLIEATFMGRQFFSHTQICGVDLRIIKRKSAWLTYLHTVRLPVPGHFYLCVVSKYLLRENEISFFTIIKHYHSPK